MKKRNRFDLLRGQHGASLVELAFLMPLFLLLLLGAIDLGRAFYLAIEVAGAAHAAAEYGYLHPSDTTGMQNAAKNDAPNVTLSFPTLNYGCECATDTAGTTYSASCTTTPTCTGNNVVYRVKVTVTGSYTPWFPWHWAGMGSIPSSISFSSTAAMRSPNG
jgi:Flp pilus assembly protein TadG